MKKFSKKIILIFFIIISLIALILGLYFYYIKNNFTQASLESTNLNIQYSDQELSGEWQNCVAKITLSDDKVTVEGTGVKNDNNVITLYSAGTYYITGKLSNGSIQINANKNDDVQLVLDNCSITNNNSSAINGIQCNKLTITLADDSINELTDSANYTLFTDTESQEPDGTIFTKTDLVINGNGKLIINGNYKDGIVSKDGLKIINANIEINSQDDAIKGKDYVAINNATIDITSEGDGIKSTNNEDSSLGYISIESGNININSKCDGIQAETILNISENANINITTNGEIAKTTTQDNGGFGGFGGAKNSKFSTYSSSEDTQSSKALKAGSEIAIESGNFEISSTDDSIHSNGTLIINGGTFKISSEDDGIHSDTSIVINAGTIDISKSYEGIESNYIEINNGDISIVASDDGINVAGGNDGSSINGRVGQNNFSSTTDSNTKLVINNGNIKVNSNGDGLDSNNAIYINGGNIVVIGPTSSGNGALDYERACIVTGGNLVYYGSDGMWQNPSNDSTQYSLAFSNSGKSGDKIELKNSSGETLASFTAEESYNAVGFSNAYIKSGEKYTLYINGSSVSSLQATSVVTSNVSSSGFGGGNTGAGGGFRYR